MATNPKEPMNLHFNRNRHAEHASFTPHVSEALRSPGRPLDTESRAFFEPRFGHDFSKVRIHTDAQAVESARSVNALAYIVGRNIVFGKKQYAPDTVRGRKLLAHELAHVVQQNVSGVSAGESSRVNAIDPPSSPSEREADLMSEAAVGLGAKKNLMHVESPATHTATGALQRAEGSGAYLQGYRDGLNGNPPIPGPLDEDALVDYNEGYAKGHYEFTQTSSPASGAATAGTQQERPASMSVAERTAYLDQQYNNWLLEQNWAQAAESLNGFSKPDIEKRLSWRSPYEIEMLHQGAVNNPRVGPQSNVAIMTADENKKKGSGGTIFELLAAKGLAVGGEKTGKKFAKSAAKGLTEEEAQGLITEYAGFGGIVGEAIDIALDPPGVTGIHYHKAYRAVVMVGSVPIPVGDVRIKKENAEKDAQKHFQQTGDRARVQQIVSDNQDDAD
jgi:Domain of unknown function (DUF4157)